MTHAALAPMIGPAFDPFLVAVIGEDRNEKTVSVLSALARLDVDPWEEVASLAIMPRALARDRLAALIGALPDAPKMQKSANEVAGDLIGLLPSSGEAMMARAKIVSSGTGLSRDSSNAAPLAIAALLALFLALLAYRGLVDAAPILTHADGAASEVAPIGAPTAGLEPLRK
jgi:hypothetical protein